MKRLSEIYNSNFSNPKLAELLKSEIIAGADLNDRGFYFGSLIGTITEKDFIQLYTLLKERGGYFELLKVLMDDHYDINVRDSNGENALFNLVKRYNDPVNFKTRLKTAIAMGVDYRLENSQGENLLHGFANGGCPDEFLDELLQLPLDINKANTRGWTPLHLLCVNRNTDGAIKILIDHGADTKIRTSPGEDQYLQEQTENYEDISDGSYSAFELRMKYIQSIGGEYSEGTEGYEELVATYRELFKEDE